MGAMTAPLVELQGVTVDFEPRRSFFGRASRRMKLHKPAKAAPIPQTTGRPEGELTTPISAGAE